MHYEYCVMVTGDDAEPHLGPWPLLECCRWIDEWIANGGKGSTFYVARRPLGLWERV